MATISSIAKPEAFRLVTITLRRVLALVVNGCETAAYCSLERAAVGNAFVQSASRDTLFSLRSVDHNHSSVYSLLIIPLSSLLLLSVAMRLLAFSEQL